MVKNTIWPQSTFKPAMTQVPMGPEGYMYAQTKDDIHSKVPEDIKKLELKEESEKKKQKHEKKEQK